MTSAPPAVTKPDAGVIATRPATAPHAAPSTLTLRLWAYAIRTQLMVAAAAAVLVTTRAFAARPPAVSADGRRHAGRDMDDRAAGEVESAEPVQPAVRRPDPVRDRRIHEERPGHR